jgi:serine protease Do
MASLSCRILPLLALALSLAGCASLDKSFISTAPSTEVQYATTHISPAVVRIDVVAEYFDQGVAKPVRSIGSGVIIDPQGHILTNFHVAGRAKRLDVTLYNLEHVKATLIGSDHWTDLALIQLDMDEVHKKGYTFQWAALADSSKVQLGQPVLAVGTPFGFSRTVTAGIVSNTDRFTDDLTNIDGYETGLFNNWIQTDAPINPGNSGGPLVNMRGEIIGINSKGLTAGNSLAFAIPSDTCKQVIAEILAHKKVRRSYIGIQLQPLQDLETYYELAVNKGALISSIEPDSPAAKAGLHPGETYILLAINDVPLNVRFPEQLAAARRLIADQPIGTTLKLTVTKATHGHETPIITSVTTEKLESVITEERALAAWGISVRDLTRSYIRRAHITPVEGVLITSISDGSPAQEAKLQVEDIITRVNDRYITSADDLEDQLKRLGNSSDPVRVEVRRDRSALLRIIKPKG